MTTDDMKEAIASVRPLNEAWRKRYEKWNATRNGTSGTSAQQQPPPSNDNHSTDNIINYATINHHHNNLSEKKKKRHGNQNNGDIVRGYDDHKTEWKNTL